MKTFLKLLTFVSKNDSTFAIITMCAVLALMHISACILTIEYDDIRILKYEEMFSFFIPFCSAIYVAISCDKWINRCLASERGYDNLKEISDKELITRREVIEVDWDDFDWDLIERSNKVEAPK